MSDWLHNLPILWMTLIVFGLTYLITAAIQGLVTTLAKGERARAFKAISTGMLSPLAIIFGLFVVFTAAQTLNRGCEPWSAATLSKSQLRNGR
jgi:nitrogen fixation/metabolism regulation signal transduction histidine kinase